MVGGGVSKVSRVRVFVMVYHVSYVRPDELFGRYYVLSSVMCRGG